VRRDFQKILSIAPLAELRDEATNEWLAERVSDRQRKLFLAAQIMRGRAQTQDGWPLYGPGYLESLLSRPAKGWSAASCGGFLNGS
jgi:hypothetical protein